MREFGRQEGLGRLGNLCVGNVIVKRKGGQEEDEENGMCDWVCDLDKDYVSRSVGVNGNRGTACTDYGHRLH